MPGFGEMMPQKVVEFKAGEYCEVCGEGDSVNFVCDVCGASICSDCFNEAENMCLLCSETICSVCNQCLSSRACDICGRLVCEDHGIREGEATICVRCQ